MDKFYPWGQASVINFWHFTSMSTWFKKNVASDTRPTWGYLYTAGMGNVANKQIIL